MDSTGYKTDYSAVAERPDGAIRAAEAAEKQGEKVVEAIGLEPTASWSRTRFKKVLKSPNFLLAATDPGFLAHNVSGSNRKDKTGQPRGSQLSGSKDTSMG